MSDRADELLRDVVNAYVDRFATDKSRLHLRGPIDEEIHHSRAYLDEKPHEPPDTFVRVAAEALQRVKWRLDPFHGKDAQIAALKPVEIAFITAYIAGYDAAIRGKGG